MFPLHLDLAVLSVFSGFMPEPREIHRLHWNLHFSLKIAAFITIHIFPMNSVNSCGFILESRWNPGFHQNPKISSIKKYIKFRPGIKYGLSNELTKDQISEIIFFSNTCTYLSTTNKSEVNSWIKFLNTILPTFVRLWEGWISGCRVRPITC